MTKFIHYFAPGIEIDTLPSPNESPCPRQKQLEASSCLFGLAEWRLIKLQAILKVNLTNRWRWKLKEYKSVMLQNNHKVGYPAEIFGVSEILEDYQKNGWHLHTYQVTYCSVDHPTYNSGFYTFLLFEKEKTA